MKLCGFLLIISFSIGSLKTEAQTVSLSAKNVALKEIFASLKSQTGILFFYDAELLREAKPVSIVLKNVPLDQALNEIFKSQSLAWVLEDRTVTIIKSPAQTPAPPVTVPQHPTRIALKGRIVDGNRNPIPQVSVLIKGTKKGTVSDEGGKFFLAAEEKTVLVFTSVNYGPKEMKVQQEEMFVQLQLEVKPMELLLVGGNLNAIKRKADATSVTTLDSKSLEKIPVNTVDQVFRGWVPGTNSFDVGDAPEGFPTLSIRGAGGPNSLSTIAVYIDGIEYAGGSGYLSQLDKTNIDRIEVVRGPGAATMYGTGSNGGIVQIFTKKGSTGQNSVNLTGSAGFYKSKWVESDPFQQMHQLESNTAFKQGWLAIGGSYRTVAAYLPDGGEKNKGFYGSANFTFGKLQANLTGRYNVRNFNVSRPPYYDTALHPRTDIILEPVQGLRTPAYIWMNVRPTISRGKKGITETVITGVNLSHRTTGNWLNNFEAGYTVNRSQELPIPDGVTPLQTQYSSFKSSITTIRYSNVLSLDNKNGLEAVITSGGEYKKYSDYRSFTRSTAANTNLFKNPDNENYGVFVQAIPSYKNVYLTLGLRYENNTLFEPTWNPRVGLTTNFDTRSLTFKPRLSWGKGITAPTYQQRFGLPPVGGNIIYANPGIKPQSQQGFDYGLEVFGRKGQFRFEIVYYDNILQDMIAQQTLGPEPLDSTLTGLMFTNVGKVLNTGWEFSGEYKIGRFNLRGTYSIMNSIMHDTSGAYRIATFKDKLPGTRMLSLPSHTAGLNIIYSFYKLFRKGDKGIVSVNLTEVDGVQSFDYRSYAVDVAYGRTPYVPGGPGYLFENSSVFRLGLYAEYYFTKDARFFVQGANILNNYDYEYSSDYPTHGATWLFGIKVNFIENQ